jgi:hypothetical protein
MILLSVQSNAEIIAEVYDESQHSPFGPRTLLLM